MKTLILCGGLGTRLAGASGDLPKPMVPVGGKPMVWHIMNGFAHWGFRDFILCLGYRSDLFKQYFLNLSVMLHDVTLDLSNGGEPHVRRIINGLTFEAGAFVLCRHRRFLPNRSTSSSARYSQACCSRTLAAPGHCSSLLSKRA